MTPQQLALCKKILNAYSIRQWHVSENLATHTVVIHSDPVLWSEIIQKLESEMKGFSVAALPLPEAKEKP